MLITSIWPELEVSLAVSPWFSLNGMAEPRGMNPPRHRDLSNLNRDAVLKCSDFARE